MTSPLRKGRRAYVLARNATAFGRLECTRCGCPLVAGWSLNTHPRQRAWMLGRGVRHATAEHILPRALGGSNEPDNLSVWCLECNNAKHTMELWEFLLETCDGPEQVRAVEARMEAERSAVPSERWLLAMRAKLRAPPGAAWGPGRSPGGPSPTARTYNGRRTGRCLDSGFTGQSLEGLGK